MRQVVFLFYKCYLHPSVDNSGEKIEISPPELSLYFCWRMQRWNIASLCPHTLLFSEFPILIPRLTNNYQLGTYRISVTIRLIVRSVFENNIYHHRHFSFWLVISSQKISFMWHLGLGRAIGSLRQVDRGQSLTDTRIHIFSTKCLSVEVELWRKLRAHAIMMSTWFFKIFDPPPPPSTYLPETWLAPFRRILLLMWNLSHRFYARSVKPFSHNLLFLNSVKTFVVCITVCSNSMSSSNLHTLNFQSRFQWIGKGKHQKLMRQN